MRFLKFFRPEGVTLTHLHSNTKFGQFKEHLVFSGRQAKKVVNFLRKKVHPRQNPGYAYAHLTDVNEIWPDGGD